METKMTSSYTTDVAVLCIILACPIPSSLSHMWKKPLRSLTVRINGALQSTPPPPQAPSQAWACASRGQ
ncbi:hypothetical protein LEMLEM_LOCUS6783 [Lemmus lemmus]